MVTTFNLCGEAPKPNSSKLIQELMILTKVVVGIFFMELAKGRINYVVSVEFYISLITTTSLLRKPLDEEPTT